MMFNSLLININDGNVKQKKKKTISRNTVPVPFMLSVLFKWLLCKNRNILYYF